MVVQRVALAAAVAFALARDCGAEEQPPSGANAPCTRARDCAPGLVCVAGACADPNASVTPGVPYAGDASGDAAGDAAGDASGPRDASDDGG